MKPRRGGSKRDVITIDDDEPTAKASRRDEELVPIAQVLELRQQLAMAEDKFKRACQSAGQKETRIRYLEGIVDTKPDIVGHCEAKEQIEALEKTVAELTSALEEEKKRSGEERKRSEEERVKDKARIIELECLVDHYKEWSRRKQQPVQQAAAAGAVAPSQQQLQQPPAAKTQQLQAKPNDETIDEDSDGADVDEVEADDVSDDGRTEGDEGRSTYEAFKLHETGDPNNIFQLCRPNTTDSFSLSGAIQLLRPKFKARDPSKWAERMRERAGERLECDVCNRVLPVAVALDHFLSTQHIRKVEALGAGVSFEAMLHWRALLRAAAADDAIDDDYETSTEDDDQFAF